MRPPGNAQGAERSYLAPTQTEATDDRFLPLCQERPDAAQATGHAERIDLELGACVAPGSQQAISHVFCHARIIVDIRPCRYYLTREILMRVRETNRAGVFDGVPWCSS